MNWLTSVLGLPPDALKAIGTIAIGALLGVGTYVVGRIKEARKPAEQVLGGPRMALDPADRDLGYTLVRSVTDLTRGLHEHGERLRDHGELLEAERRARRVRDRGRPSA